MKKTLLSLFAALTVAAGCGDSYVKSFKTTGQTTLDPAETPIDWSGYTNWWNSMYARQVRSGNLSKVNMLDATKMLEQRRRDMAEELGLPTLQMQEGFMDGLLREPFTVAENPDARALKAAFRQSGSVLAFIDKDSELGEALAAKAPEEAPVAPSYQLRGNRERLDAFVLRKGSKRLYAAVGTQADLARLQQLIAQAQDVVSQYDLKRGWFGVQTDIRTVTCSPMTPIETMAAGMNEGNSWFVFSGEYERFIKSELERWISESDSGVLAAVGTHSLYDCSNWDGFQEQLLRDNQYEYARERDARGGYLFRPIQEWGDYAGTGLEIYNGYFASEGNKEIVDTCGIPFVLTTGNISNGATNAMVLFTPKGETFDRPAMWKAIMDRREVAIESNSESLTVMGDARWRETTQLLMVEQAFLENYFGDQVDITARVEGTTLKIRMQNYGSKTAQGTFSVSLPETVTPVGAVRRNVSVPGRGIREISLDLNPSPEAMGRRSAITIGFDWGTSSKKVMAEMDMPQGVATHKLLYGSTSGCKFPVSVFNFTNDKNVDVKVSVSQKDAPDEVAFEAERSLQLAKAEGDTLLFDLQLPAGSYTVTTTAMGATALTQLGIGECENAVTLRREDVNGDGIDEIIMENSRVRVMLLAIGARVIEYYVKDKDDNVFFKNWPNQPYDPERPYRKRNFWPFGGFEDFLGQASVETHEVYDTEVVCDGGEYAEVRMKADYWGNTIEKTFTLYGDSPLLGIRFALDMINPEFNVLGPQPILEVGAAHDEQDRVIVPESDGLHEYIMERGDYWGKFLFPVQGWNADYDTVEDVYFLGAFPVDQPFTLHMWHNHPRNRDTRFYYCELQPWMEIFRGNTTYFSYYMWADGGPWEEGLEALRQRNLITEKQ